MIISQLLAVMETAARAGGAVTKRYFGKDLAVAEKSTVADFQTKADLEAEQAVVSVLKSRYPDYNILGEETGFTDKGSEYTFIIDPLDGSNNFVVGVPYFATAIALRHNTSAAAAVIYNPIMDRAYMAEKGKGAIVNGKPLHLSAIREPERSTVAYSCAYQTPQKLFGGAMGALCSMPHKRITVNWSPTNDFCLLASGKIEGMISNGSELYDFMAGKLICREAGAKITDFSGVPDENDMNAFFIVSVGEPLHKKLLSVMRPYV